MPEQVTVFGGSGFIGRHLVERLLERGASVRIVARHARQELFEQASTGPEWLTGDITEAVIREQAVEGTDAVVNLVGTTTAPNAEAFFELHREAPRRLAEAARRAGVDRFIQISAMGVAEDAPALADRSKAAGERAVREAFAGAIIVRPALVYGPDDHFLTRFAALVRSAPAIPLIGGGRTRFQPIHVADAAETLARLVAVEERPGPIVALGAAEVFSFRELIETLCAAIGRRPWLIPVPFTLARLGAALTERLPNPPLTLDQVRLLQTDKVIGPDEQTPAAVGVRSRTLGDFLKSAEARPLFERRAGGAG
jgi:NADH dehydrogenase